ncbi:MAG: hypothetical protein P8J44_03770 [Gammaproteobacteria bacterium]|nr:hypothetical protein [Gammaproteobacteria bacterium]
MDSQDYYIAWSIYLTAGVVFSLISWKLMKRYFWREMAYLLESLLLAIIFTPWYVLPEEEILAPALIVFMLDLITVDLTTSIRALIPLVMAMLFGIIVTLVLSIIYRIKRRGQTSA